MLKVSEIFYSLQGEGYRAGEASLFIRLQGCSAKNACYNSGVICDTEFDLDDEGGMTGYFGMLMVYFCPFCFSSMIDMSKQILGINDEEESE